MRKGGNLEREIDKVLKFLDSQGIHGHKNHAKRAPDGTFIQGEPFDYEVFSPSKTYCFDAKECQSKAWPLSAAKLSQVNNMLKCSKAGCESFFLVYFTSIHKLIRFDIKTVQEKLGQRGSMSPEEGVEFDWQVFLK